MKQQILAGFVMAFAVAAAVAETQVEVGRVKRRYTVKHGVELVASCPKLDAFPMDVVPAFRFDASSRTGWVMVGDFATRIPSLVGNRYLTTNEAEYVQWKCWKNSMYPLGAELKLNEDKVGIQGPYLDFGALGSRCGLLFDVDRETGSNGVFKIRTVIAVFESSRSGGLFLGGGWGVKTSESGTGCSDGYAFYRSTASYSCPFGFYQYTGMSQYGLLFHDALWPSAPMLTGFNGGWEVLAWRQRSESPDANATGVGVGWLASNRAGDESGGQSIAELIIYTNRLTDAECKKVSAHLRRKWFGEAVPGYDGLAEAGVLHVSNSGEDGAVRNNRTGGAVDASASVGAGEKLVADRLSGGYHGGTFTKKGSGTLALRSADTYGGNLRVSEGTLSFPRRAIPSALPLRGCVLHLDADNAGSRTVRTAGDVSYLTDWRDADGGTYGVEAHAETCQPTLRYGDFANGKPCVDFGVNGSGCIMDVVDANSKTATIARVMSFVYVLGAQEGGGALFGSVSKSFGGTYAYYLDRGGNTTSFRSPLWWTSGVVNQICYGRDDEYAGAYYFNGEKDGYYISNKIEYDKNIGFQTPGWQTVGANVLCGQILTVGGTRWKSYPCTGGMRLAELLVYDRPLTEQETRDASAYLAWKWFGEVNVGYSSPTGGTLRVAERITVGTACSLDVDADSVRIDTLATNAVASVVTKTGAGSLEVVSADVSTLNVASGTVRVVASSDPATASTPAAGSSLWLDATEADTLTTTAGDGVTEVKVWGDRNDPRKAVYTSASSPMRPYLNENAKQNGHALVDLGSYGSDGATINFDRSLDNIRSVYAVVRFDPDGAAPLLGFSMDDTLFGPWPARASADFMRRNKPTDVNRSFLSTAHLGFSAVYLYGTILTNGVQTTYAFEPSADCQLVEVHLTKGAYASALGYEAAGTAATSGEDARQMRGGIRVGELIVYERSLTDREKIATRNYLMKKWFAKTDAELTPLPEKTAATAKFASVNVASGASFEVAEGATLTGDLAYANGATLTVNLSTNAQGVVSAEVVKVAGTVSFGSPLSVKLVPALPLSMLDGVKLTVLTATDLTGAENVRAATLDAPYAGVLGLRAYGGKVVLKNVNRGFLLIVR